MNSWVEAELVRACATSERVAKMPFELGDVGVDLRGAVVQPGDVALDLRQGLAGRAPEGQAALEDVVPLLVGAAVLRHHLLVDLVQRVADVGEDALDHAVAVGLDLGELLDRLDPLGRRRRHLAAALVVFLDVRDLVHQLALDCRIPLQIALHERGDALELALDAELELAAAVREQDLAIARLQAGRRSREPVRAEPQRVRQRTRQPADEVLHRRARGIQKGHGDHQQNEQRQEGLVRPDQEGFHSFLHGCCRGTLLPAMRRPGSAAIAHSSMRRRR